MSMIVTYKDCRQFYCVRGIRVYCKKYGVDYELFKKQGIPVEQLEATGDGLILKVIAEVRKRNGL